MGAVPQLSRVSLDGQSFNHFQHSPEYDAVFRFPSPGKELGSSVISMLSLDRIESPTGKLDVVAVTNQKLSFLSSRSHERNVA